MTRLEYSIEIEAPPEKVYDFYTNVDNLAKLFPGKVEVKKNYEGNPKVGDTMDISGDLGGQKFKQNMKWTELVPSTRTVWAQVSGDMKSLIDTVSFEKTSTGTRVSEIWEYEPPYSFLGKILDALKMRKEMENYLTEGNRKAKEILEK